MAMTKEQHKVFFFINEFIAKLGYSPSFKEIGAGVGLSSYATIHKHIKNLTLKGYIKRGYNSVRGIEISSLRFKNTVKRTNCPHCGGDLKTLVEAKLEAQA